MKDSQRKAMFAKSGKHGHGLSSKELGHDEFVRKASQYFQIHNVEPDEANLVAERLGKRLFR